MKKILNIVVAVMLLFVTESQSCLEYYIGSDLQLRHMNFKPGYGGNLFKHDSTQNNIYVGLRVNEYMAFEAGHQSSYLGKRTANHSEGDSILGCPPYPPGYSSQVITSVRMNLYYMNVLGFRSISEDYRLKFIGLVGAASVRANLERTLVLFNNVPINIEAKFTTRETIIRLGGGLEHMITKSWGVRTFAIWENTGSLSVTALTPIRCRVVKPRNSWTYSLGVFVKF